MHQSAGAVIKNNQGEILLIERAIFPFGWSCPSGHIEEGENPEQGMKREIFEETGLKVRKSRLLFNEFLDWNECSRGVVGHNWFLYEVSEWTGKLKKEESEVKNINWVAISELKKLKLEEAYKYWFKKLGYL
ncbi:MAG: NUDIX hydrolase [Patescibacteria group bacterium]|nr:NUDIX hydrolase [Patescibacteria group bacterium]